MKKIILFLVAVVFLAPWRVSSSFLDVPPRLWDCKIFYGEKGYDFNSEIKIKQGDTIRIEGVLFDDCFSSGIDGELKINWSKSGIETGSMKKLLSWSCGLMGPSVRKEFGDSHTYIQSGTYSPELLAEDPYGNEVRKEWTVVVTGGSDDDGGGPAGDITIGPFNLPNPFGPDVENFGDLIDKIISFVFTLVIILAPILLVVAGIMFLFAGGDPAKVQKAKKLILYTIIGFTIIALSKLFVELIQGVFGVKES